MPALSYVHQLFSADTCQTYLRGLRWKERPLQCPRCQSHGSCTRTLRIIVSCAITGWHLEGFLP
jgi:Transposase zinc-ribbon domain